jgi:hypothetical protein
MKFLSNPLFTLIVSASLFHCHAFQGNLKQPERLVETSLNLNRRSFVASTAASIGFLVASSPANAGIDPSLLKSLPVQGDESGASQRLRQIENIQKPATDLVDKPFEELPSGVSYREYRDGKGEVGE